jgi:hypothetical protein
VQSALQVKRYWAHHVTHFRSTAMLAIKVEVVRAGMVRPGRPEYSSIGKICEGLGL